MKPELIMALAALLCTVLLGVKVCAKSGRAQSKRYVAVQVGHGYNVYDLNTKKWLQRQIQLRVSTSRKLPEPLISLEHGNLLHCTDYDPGGCGTGNLVPDRFVVRDAFKIWQWRKAMNREDLQGKNSFSISVDRLDQEGRKTAPEPTEIFSLPPIDKQEPGQWTEWQGASSQRQGEFAWWQEVHKQELPEPVNIEYPFEMRWRIQLTDEPRLIDDEGIE